MGSPVLNEQPPAPVPFFPDSAYLTKEPTTRSPLPSTPDLDPPGAHAGGAWATLVSVPRLLGLLQVALGAPQYGLGMQNGAKIRGIQASGIAPGSFPRARA